MDTFMDKISQKRNAQEMIRANAAADAAKLEQLRYQTAEYEMLLQEIRKVNLRTTESVDQLQKVLQAGLQKIEEIQKPEDTQIDQEELLNSVKELIEEASRRSDDFIHKEDVKVYRNVQASMVEELGKQTETLLQKQKESASKQKALLPIGVVVMLLVLADIGLHLCLIFSLF